MARKSKKPALSREELRQMMDDDIRHSCMIIEQVRYPNAEACAAALVAGGYEADDLSSSELLDAVGTLNIFEDLIEEIHLQEEELYF